MVSFAVGFGVAAGRGVGLIVVGGATGRGVALTVGLAVSLIVGRAVVGATGLGVVFTVGRAVMVGRAVVGGDTGLGVVGAAAGRGVVGAVTGRGVGGAATGRGVAFTVGPAVVAGGGVGRAVGDGSAAALFAASARRSNAFLRPGAIVSLGRDDLTWGWRT